MQLASHWIKTSSLLQNKLIFPASCFAIQLRFSPSLRRFLAFFAEVIKQTILAKDKRILTYVIITTAATGGRTGLPLDAEQLKFSS